MNVRDMYNTCEKLMLQGHEETELTAMDEKSQLHTTITVCTTKQTAKHFDPLKTGTEYFYILLETDNDDL